MPLVITPSVSLADGTVVTQFRDTTSTSNVTYTFPKQQTGLLVTNEGVATIILSVGSYTNISIAPNETWKVDANYTTFTIRSTINSQAFFVSGRIKESQDLSVINQRLSAIEQEISAIEGGGEQVVKSDLVQTTTGKFWSTTVTEANTTLDSIKQKVVTKSLNTTKRIVLMGSSSTEGEGPTNISNSYANRLAQRLTSRGYEVINRGVGSDHTVGAIARFFKDVVPLNPDFVIFAFTIGNEGIYDYPDKMAVYNQFRNNMFKLIHMTKKFGAVPIVFTQAPTQLFNTEIYNYSKKLQDEFEESGVLCLDWGGVVDDLSGQPFGSIMRDPLHYNDVAHKEICNAIPPTLFEKAVTQNGGFLQSQKGSIRYAATMSTATPIFFTPSDEITTFTYFARYKKDTDENLCGLISFSGTDRAFISFGGEIGYSSNTVTDFQIEYSKSHADGEWFSFAVTYSPISSIMRFYINGVFKAQTVTPTIPTKFSVGGRDNSSYYLRNANVKDVALYRTRLKDYQIAQLHDGIFPQTSLEIFSPMHDRTVFPNGKLINLAGTTSNFVVNVGETGISSSTS